MKVDKRKELLEFLTDFLGWEVMELSDKRYRTIYNGEARFITLDQDTVEAMYDSLKQAADKRNQQIKAQITNITNNVEGKK